jgi:DNA-binding IclR family transcriptional regulator
MIKDCVFENRAKNTINSSDMFLSEVERIRQAGYSTDNQEFVDGMIAVATAITDHRGTMVASLAFHAPTPRMDLDQALTYLETLKSAAAELSRIFSDGM